MEKSKYVCYNNRTNKNEREMRILPNWKVHLEIAKKLNKQINFDKEDLNLFLLGNIAPDINNGFIVKEISHIYNHDQTHLYNEKNHSTYTNFYNKYKDILKTNPVAYGYFIHLYTDYLLNQDYHKKCEHENLDKEECIKVKHKDLKKYDSKYSENIIALDNYQKAVEELQTIDEISINEQDLKKVIEFLEGKEKTNDLNLEFYTVQELDQEVENITNEIYKFISLH